MVSAKDIELKPIPAKLANSFVKRVHYSGKVVQNSQLHIGVYLNGMLHGVMQFGPSLDKRKIQGLVSGTKWHEFIELNRMAFDDVLPRNSESRAIAVAMKLVKKHAPQVKWVISFADATQCGDGTIYRASGFVLTGIKENASTWVLENGEIFNSFTATAHRATEQNGKAGVGYIKSIGGEKASGFQLRYIYFIDKSYRQRLTVPELPFEKIKEMGAAMYKGEKM